MSAWGKSWGFAWGNAWGLVTRPYIDLSTAEKVYVRELLSSIYVREDVERVVALASEESISVLEATEWLHIHDRAETIFATLQRQQTVEPRTVATKTLTHQDRPAYVRDTQSPVFVAEERHDLFIQGEQHG